MSTITSTTDVSQSELTSLRAAVAAQTPVPTGPVSFVDRLAMRAGLALILWSRGHGATGSERAAAAPGDWRTVRPIRQQRPFC